MGTRGYRSFENDDALDWVGELVEAEDTGPISEALDAVLEADYVEAPEASIGLAAAEVVAAMMGNPAEDLPDEVQSWIVGKEPPEPALVEKAQTAVERILEDSELKELWEDPEDEESAKWREEVEGLLRRLGSA